ncbi:MAG: response regulator transcription factor [Gammaproteobacteria bacterium]|nr:response regulator transcription factor [Gammaproteobacteria bacterium]
MKIEKPNIVFVDDDDLLLQGLKRALRKMLPSWSMQFVNSAAKVIEVCQHSTCDIVVTDLLMPQMNGIELIMKLNEDFPQIQCVMLSGTADLEDAIELINNSQIALFYTKPCDTEVLISGLKKLLIKILDEPFKPSLEHLMELFALTRSEARLIQPLLIGKSIEESAKDCGLTVSSARTYLKRIFSKTDTNRQAELVSKILLKLSVMHS